MATEHHIPGHNLHEDAYVDCYRRWAKSLGIHGKVLDLGCGTGWCMTQFIAPDCTIVLGIDAYSGPPWAEHPKAIYLRQDATQFSAPGQFDHVLSFEFIEHIAHYDLLRLLRNVKESLIPSGRFLGTTPNGPEGRLVSKTVNPFHVREWHEKELRNILEHFFGNVCVSDIGLNILGFECQK